MIGVVMAGGKGTRMHLSEEKLLLKNKHPIIINVINALKYSNCFSKIIAVTSPNSPKTRKLLSENKIENFETSGIGFVQDLNQVLQTLDEPVLVVPGDLPLLDKEIVKKINSMFDESTTWNSILVTREFLESINMKSEFHTEFQNRDCNYTGISLVNSKNIKNLENVQENYIILNDKRVAFNLNTKEDYELLSAS